MSNLSKTPVSFSILRKPWLVTIATALAIMALIPAGRSLAQSGGWWPGVAQMKLVKDEKTANERSVLFLASEGGRPHYTVGASEYRDPNGRLKISYTVSGRDMRLPNGGKYVCPDMKVPLTDLAAFFGRRPVGTDFPCQYQNGGGGRAALVGDFFVTGSGVTAAKAAPAKGQTAAATTAAQSGPTCTKDDIEGNWRRSDGATVTLIGVQIFGGSGSGGVALLFNHPAGWWPKGHHKFTKIYRTGGPRSCKMTAMCANYDRMASGQIKRNERPCVLEVDPKARTMTESGTRLTYSRP